MKGVSVYSNISRISYAACAEACTRPSLPSRRHAQSSAARQAGICAVHRSTSITVNNLDGVRCFSRCCTVASASASSAAAAQQPKPKQTKLVISVSLVLLFGVLNRVFNKMATVPMGNYLFFLAQIQTFGYVLFYGVILLARKRMGKVTDEMLQVADKKKFAYMGGLEAVAQVTSMICVSQLPGVVLPLLNQTILLWQTALGYYLQGVRYSKGQVVGILLVVAGVAKAAWPSASSGSILGQTNPVYAVGFSAAFLLLALSAVLKDKLFQEAKHKLNGQNLDLFVVNTSSSLAQAGFVFLLLPVMSSLKGIQFSQLPAYLLEGSRAFRGKLPGTSGAPGAPLLYIVINLAFNIATLNLLRTAGAVTSTLTLSSLIPLTILAFTFQWPLIGSPANLNTNFVLGTVILLSGLVAYNWQKLTGSSAKVA